MKYVGQKTSKSLIFAKMLILEHNPFQNRFLRKNIQFPKYLSDFSERILLYWHSPNVGLECCLNGPFKYWLKNNQYVESKQQATGSKTLNYFRIYSYFLTAHWFTLWKETILRFRALVFASYKLYFVKTYTENQKLMNFHWF